MAAFRRSRALLLSAEGELVSLIGANGAGKTTTLKAITGLQPVASGTIEFMGKTSRGKAPGTSSSKGW